MTEIDNNTVEIDVKDLKEVMQEADAYRALHAELYITPDEVSTILQEDSFDHDNFTVDRKESQWDSELEDLITMARNAV